MTSLCKDDTALLAETSEQLKRMVNSNNGSFKMYSMDFNAKKTKVRITSKKDIGEQLEIVVNDAKLEQMKQYTHLGSFVKYDGRCLREMKKRILQAKKHSFSKRTDARKCEHQFKTEISQVLFL